MNCFSEEELDAYLDGYVTPGLEEHLQQCEACISSLDSMRRLREMLDSLDPVDPPEDLVPRVMAEVLSTAPSLQSRILAMASLGSAGLVGLLLAGIIRDRFIDVLASVLSSAGTLAALLRLTQGMLADTRTTLWVMFRIPQAGLACVSVALAVTGLVLIIAGFRRESRSPVSHMEYEEEIA